MTQNTQTTRERIAVLIHWEGIVEAPNIIAAEIDRLTAEVATLTLKLANARLNLKHCSEEVDKRDECAEQLAGARAEIDRLRLPAEAWEAQRRYAAMFADNLRGRVSDVDLACLEAEYESAAARARAAKVTP